MLLRVRRLSNEGVGQRDILRFIGTGKRMVMNFLRKGSTGRSFVLSFRRGRWGMSAKNGSSYALVCSSISR